MEISGEICIWIEYAYTMTVTPLLGLALDMSQVSCEFKEVGIFQEIM